MTTTYENSKEEQLARWEKWVADNPTLGKFAKAALDLYLATMRIENEWQHECLADMLGDYETYPIDNLFSAVADCLGVPPDTASQVPYEQILEAYCRDWLGDLAIEVAHDPLGAPRLIGEMLLAADIGDDSGPDRIPRA